MKRDSKRSQNPHARTPLQRFGVTPLARGFSTTSLTPCPETPHQRLGVASPGQGLRVSGSLVVFKPFGRCLPAGSSEPPALSGPSGPFPRFGPHPGPPPAFLFARFGSESRFGFPPAASPVFLAAPLRAQCRGVGSVAVGRCPGVRSCRSRSSGRSRFGGGFLLDRDLHMV